MLSILRQLWFDDEGPTAVEYGLLLALIAVMVIIGASFLGTQVNARFNQVGTAIQGSTGT